MAIRLQAGVVVLALLAAALCARPASAQENARQNGVLRVGTVAGNKPWAFRDGRGQLVGFDVDLAVQIARALDLKPEMRAMSFPELLAALPAGEVDMAASTVTITPERLARFSFSQPYYDAGHAVLVMKQSGIRRLDDLADKTVGVTGGTTNEAWLAANGERYRVGRSAIIAGPTRAAEELETGRIDAYLGDLPALAYQQLQHPGLSVIGRLASTQQYGLAMARNSPLAPRVDAVLSRLKTDGTMARIHKRWFGMAPERNSATVTVLPRP